jgi:hypothetical protein
MTDLHTSVYLQSLVVVRSNPDVTQREFALPHSPSVGNYVASIPSLAVAGSNSQASEAEPHRPWFVVANASTPDLGVNILPSEPRVLTMSFSSVPVISQAELMREYWEFGEALNEMSAFDQGDEWRIELSVLGVSSSSTVRDLRRG